MRRNEIAGKDKVKYRAKTDRVVGAWGVFS